MGGKGSGFTREKRLVNQQLGINKSKEILPAGDSFMVPNLSGVKGFDDKLIARGYTAGSVLFSDGINW